MTEGESVVTSTVVIISVVCVTVVAALVPMVILGVAVVSNESNTSSKIIPVVGIGSIGAEVVIKFGRRGSED